jgi:hypothetical protein
MLDLKDIKYYKAKNMLKEYKGINPYILKLRNIKHLTETQVNYIIDNYNFTPLVLKKIVEITDYLGDSLQESNNLKIKPTKILVEALIGETEKSYHIFFTKNSNTE